MNDIELINYLVGSIYFIPGVAVGEKEISAHLSSDMISVPLAFIQELQKETGYDFYVMSPNENQYNFIFKRKGV